MCLPETVNVFVKQILSTQVLVKWVVIDPLEYEQLVHVNIRLAP